MKQIPTNFNLLDCPLYSMSLPSKQAVSYRKIHNLHASIRKFSWRLFLVLVVNNMVPAADVYGQDESEAELTNFAFSNYLGTGFYASDSGDVFILRIPMSTTLRPMTDNEAGWVFRYPVTLGISNISDNDDSQSTIDVDDIPDLNDVGTLSIFPGIEYLYPVSPNWQLIPFFDFGIARDFGNKDNIRVLGTGIKSFVTFHLDGKWLTLGNRLLYAQQENFDGASHSDFAVFETGLDYNIPTKTTINGSTINVSFYYINYYYLEDLILTDFLDDRISLQNKNEFGFTVSLPKYSWLPDNSRLGLGVQVTKDDDLYRLVFGAPFF